MLFLLTDQASLKGITAEQLDSLGCKLCLNNTYHLYCHDDNFVLTFYQGFEAWAKNP